jgi:hypothetical protein
MDAHTQQLLAKMARYIQHTQPQLDKAASLRQSLNGYRVKIAQAIDTLVDRGVVPLQAKINMYNDLAANPEKAAELLCTLSEKMASQSGVLSLGGPSSRPNGAGLDPILSFCLDQSY